jgi:hypothetical protein
MKTRCHASRGCGGRSEITAGTDSPVVMLGSWAMVSRMRAQQSGAATSQLSGRTRQLFCNRHSTTWISSPHGQRPVSTQVNNPDGLPVTAPRHKSWLPAGSAGHRACIQVTFPRQLATVDAMPIYTLSSTPLRVGQTCGFQFPLDPLRHQ